MEDDFSRLPAYSLSQALTYDYDVDETEFRKLRCADRDSKLPGQPWIDMGTDNFLTYLRKSFSVDSLNSIAPYLWLAGTPSEFHVSPLHHMGARGRRVIVTEDPQLHLLWHHDKIFIKPIPLYLLSAPFWSYILEADDKVWQNMVGFMRSYCYLIRHEIDFRLASSSDHCLIPLVDGQEITFSEFVRFISQFEKVPNTTVAPRYSYGMLRLTRINYMAPFLLGKWTYFHIQPQWTDYLSYFIPGIITFFAVLSTILSSMQVELAVQALLAEDKAKWPEFVGACQGVAIGVIALVAFFMVSLVLFVMGMLLKEVIFSFGFMKARSQLKEKELQAVVGI